MIGHVLYNISSQITCYSQANLIWDVSLHLANQTVKWILFQCSVDTKSVLWNAHRSLHSSVLFMYSRVLVKSTLSAILLLLASN